MTASCYRLRVESPYHGGDRFYDKTVSKEAFEAAAVAQRTWQIGLIEAYEKQLRVTGIPESFWLYVARIGVDVKEGQPSTGLGTFFREREIALEYIEHDIIQSFVYLDPARHAKRYAVVDGREPDNVKRMIPASWDESMDLAWRAWRSCV